MAGPKREYFVKHDLGKLLEIEQAAIPYWYPSHRMMNVVDDNEPWGDKWRAGTSNFRTVAELFSKRNLWALAAIRDGIRARPASSARDSLMFGLSAILLNCSNMYQYRPSLKGGFMKGTYYVPQESQIISVWRAFEDKVTDLIHATGSLGSIGTGISISTQSATKLDTMLANSVDYIFTDPPYAGKVQYGELNFVWEAWLGFDTAWHDEEITVNEVRGRSEADWADMMRQAMAECYRVLKPGRWLSLCYHDTSEGTWQLVQDIMAEAGFIVDHSSESALFIETGQKSYNQLTADKVNKRDLVINLHKPRPSELSSIPGSANGGGDNGTQPFRDAARQFIRDYLQANPGSGRDRVYDELVSRMVRTGQMEAHNFEEILREVADEVKEPRMQDLFTPENPNLFGTHEVSRWYLKDTEEGTVDAAQSALEDDSAGTLRRHIEKQFEEHPHLEGVHYSDLFELYVYGVKEKPRRQMADWLVDYFYKTEDGTWRLPASVEEERLKAESRTAGTNRRIKRYAAMLASSAGIPPDKVPGPATLAEWIRHARRTGLYDAGRLLFERGGLDTSRLPEELQVEVEEDYQVCLRALQRAAGGGERGAGGGKR